MKHCAEQLYDRLFGLLYWRGRLGCAASENTLRILRFSGPGVV